MQRSIIASLTLGLLVMGVASAAADTTIRVRGNTVDESQEENGSPGWWFNRDPSTSSPYEFNFDQHSIGTGSLYVLPIGANASDKFIAENFVWQPIADLTSIGYDFLIAGNGTTADADHFYLNVYANIDDSDNYYDCRFDYTPADPSDLSDFATATFAATDVPTNVTRSGSARIPTCPATLAGMPADSHVRMFAISVGDTSANDVGLAGYLDRVRVTTTSGVTTYDFEVPPEVKNACKDDGYLDYGFENQGECVSFLQADAHAGK